MQSSDEQSDYVPQGQIKTQYPILFLYNILASSSHVYHFHIAKDKKGRTSMRILVLVFQYIGWILHIPWPYISLDMWSHLG